MLHLPNDHNSIILDSLDRHGWSVLPGFLDRTQALDLSRESQTAWDLGGFNHARISNDSNKTINADIRGDHVMWLTPQSPTTAQFVHLDKIETLRQSINQHFMLGLFDFEAHFAVYPIGAFYKPHLDRPRNTSERILTVILYLNENWQPGDGGELRLSTTKGLPGAPFQIIEPLLGTLVTFFSADHWHEVLPTLKTRRSITGWLRSRPL